VFAEATHSIGELSLQFVPGSAGELKLSHRSGDARQMEKPTISLYSSAFRPQNWMALYNSIVPSDVSFELVFVGPNEPAYRLPESCRFIRSIVKPAQCFEIGLRSSLGELVIYMADDCEFVTDHPLDRLYEVYELKNDPKNMISCRYMMDGQDQSDEAHHFFIDDKASPITPLCGLASRKFLMELGGIDRSFIAVMWDLDITMRIYKAGGRIILSDVYLNENKGRSAGSMLCSEFWSHDRGLLEKLWTSPDRKFLPERRRPVRSFSEKGLLERSQGPRGRWRGRMPLTLEKCFDFTRTKVLPRIDRILAFRGRAISAARRILAGRFKATFGRERQRHD